MPVVASVRLRYASKDYWFDPAGLSLHEGDSVLVETERGEEVGTVIRAALEVHDNQLAAPLKPIMRLTTEEDAAAIAEQKDEAKAAMARFRELVEKHELDMKPVAVEFSFDRKRATFYFTADERVDFRALVRDLASEYHTRIDMRQIGVRDEARSIGGLGHCGQELCCARLGGDFLPVGIRMAKEQDLPLNPAKISGACGRLMCCLRYEYEAYKDFKSRAPKRGAIIDTPLGPGKVVEFDTPRERVRVRFEDGKTMDIPVSAMDTGDKVAREGENIRPCHVSQVNFDAIIEELENDKRFAMMGDKLFSDDPSLADRQAQAGASNVGHTPHHERPKRRVTASAGDRRRKRGGARAAGAVTRGADGNARSSHAERHERKRRRSVSVESGEVVKRIAPNARTRTQAQPAESPAGAAPQRRSAASKPRPGQHSSTVSGTPASGAGSPKAAGKSDTPKKRRRRRGGRNRGNNGNGNKPAASE